MTPPAVIAVALAGNLVATPVLAIACLTARPAVLSNAVAHLGVGLQVTHALPAIQTRRTRLQDAFAIIIFHARREQTIAIARVDVASAKAPTLRARARVCVDARTRAVAKGAPEALGAHARANRGVLAPAGGAVSVGDGGCRPQQSRARCKT